ncbi:MAG: hypothetical protein ACK44Z_00265, partial [Pirellulaceae bacterium]
LGRGGWVWGKGAVDWLFSVFWLRKVWIPQLEDLGIATGCADRRDEKREVSGGLALAYGARLNR